MQTFKDFFEQSKNNLADNKKQVASAIKTFKQDKQTFTIEDEKINCFVENLSQKLKNKEKILIFGDYDVDGIFSTTMLYESLAEMSKKIHSNDINAWKESVKNIHVKIPSRKDGYGISPEFVSGVLSTTDTKLIITCDNGSQASMRDIIDDEHYKNKYFVFDHHANGDFSDKKYKNIVNPNADGKIEISTGLLLYKFFEALNKKYPDFKFSDKADLAAFTIVSDVASLNNNREIVLRGLDIINNAEAKYNNLVDKINKTAQSIKLKHSKNEHSPKLFSTFNKSLAELDEMEKAQLSKLRRPFFALIFKDKLGSFVTSKDLSFKAIPMLNAVNRMGGDPVELLKAVRYKQAHIEQSDTIARFIVDKFCELQALNHRRRDITKQTTTEALNEIKKRGLQDNALIFLYMKELNIGIAGLIAQRIFDRTGADVVVAAQVQQNNGEEIIAFSGRGNNVFHNLEKLSQMDINSGEIFSFGGHLKALGGRIFDVEKFGKLVDKGNKSGELVRVSDNLKEHNIIINKPMNLFDFIEFSKYLTKHTDGLPYSKNFLAPVIIREDMLLNENHILKTAKNKDFVCLKFQMFNPLNDKIEKIDYITNSDLAVDFINQLKENEKDNKMSVVLLEASTNCHANQREAFSGLIKTETSLTAQSFLSSISIAQTQNLQEEVNTKMKI